MNSQAGGFSPALWNAGLGTDKMTEMKNNIGRTHYEQMLIYAKAYEDAGWYYGNKAQFEKRHNLIVQFLEEAIEKCDKRKRVAPNAKGQGSAACGASPGATGWASNGTNNERTDK